MNYQKVIRILEQIDFRDFEYIKGCGKAIPLILPCKVFPKEFTYKSEKTFDRPIETTTRGDKNEKSVCALLRLFDFDYIYLVKSFTVLDIDYMTDIVCKKDNMWFTFQVKSSLQDCTTKLNYAGDLKPIHLVYEIKNRSILFAELCYLFKLLDIELKVDLESIKQEYIPIVKQLESVSESELNKFEVLKPGMRKKLNILYSVGELFYSNQIYRLGVTL